LSTDKARKARTVRVLIHTTSSGLFAVGVVVSEWQGAVKVSRRLAALRPILERSAAPPGVDREIWQAWCALLDLIEEQRTDGRPDGM
jgi:hypothetical protein